MKVAVISDIHGNHYALREVFRVALQEKVGKLLILGDLVGYYYHPDKVIEMINDWDHEIIRGNHENLLLDLLNGVIKESDLRKKYGSGHRMALEKLSEQNIQRITKAPEHKNVEIDGVKFSMNHGSPWDSNFYLYPDTGKEILQRCDDPDSDFVLAGHSHYLFIHVNKSSALINVGSVGQSRNTGGVANWAIIHTQNKSIEIKATPYETNSLEKEIDLVDPDIPYLKNILRRNRT